MAPDHRLCTDMRTDVSAEMCADTCTDICTGVRAGVRADVRPDRCVEVGAERSEPSHARGRAYQDAPRPCVIRAFMCAGMH